MTRGNRLLWSSSRIRDSVVPGIPMEVDTGDASPYGIGAVIRDGTERPGWLLFLVHCRKNKKDIHNDK